MQWVVSHPHGNPNSYHAARALSDAGWLQSFETGVISGAGLGAALRFLPRGIRERAVNRSYAGLPRGRIRGHVVWEALARAGGRIRKGGPARGVQWYDVLFCGHDLQVARRMHRGLDAVYAYEDGAKATFRAARRHAVACVYELPAGYYRGPLEALTRAYPGRTDFAPTLFPPWKEKRKALELDLADVVVAPCAWARSTLERAGAGRDKPVVVTPYGTPADEIAPRTSVAQGPFTALFAGEVGPRKGVPFLLEAWTRVKLPEARLLLAGGLARTHERSADPTVVYLGALPRMRLLDLMKQADLFVFPSLSEGFGMVIGEAMACGVPVLTTTSTGGPELITAGEDGWCVSPADAAALAERIEWAYRNRDALRTMGLRARVRAEGWTWGHYRAKLVAELSRFVGSGGQRP